jgi:hypothetical protein
VSPLVSCPAFYIELEFNGKPAGTFSWYLGQEAGVTLVVERWLGWLIAYDILLHLLVNERLIQLFTSLLVYLCLCHLCYTTLVLLYNKGIIRVQYISIINTFIDISTHNLSNTTICSYTTPTPKRPLSQS